MTIGFYAGDIRCAAVVACAVLAHLVLTAWTDIEGKIVKAFADQGTSRDLNIGPAIIRVKRHARGRFQQIADGGVPIPLRKATERAVVLAF